MSNKPNQIEEELIDVITLTDPEGNDVEFELIDEFDYEGSSYVVLILLGDDSGEVTILKVLHNEEGEDDDFVSPKTEEELNAVFEYFMERMDMEEVDFEEE